MGGEQSSLTLVLALAAGVFAQSIARRLHVPGIVLLLAAGAGLGPDGLDWVRPRELGHGLFAIVELAVAVILFEGGLNLQVSRLRREQRAIQRLVTIGALITLFGGTIAARWLLDWSWSLAVLFGSLVVVTGPTVVGPLVAELRLRRRVATVLEAEGVLIDPIGALIAAVIFSLVLSPGEGALQASALDLLLRIGFGGAAGLLTGFALAGLLRTHRLVPEGFGNIVVLATALLLFSGANALVAETGILAVTVAGIVVGNLDTAIDRDLREFKDQLSVLLIGLLFVLLAADVRWLDLQALGWPGVGVVAALVLIVRPINVFLSTTGTDLDLRERAFIAWVAPRGIVAAAIASIMASGLEAHGIQGGAELRALVFLTITGTVILAGATALPVASLLKLCLPGRETTAILGAQGLGLVLARELRDGGVPVIFLDSSSQNTRNAEEEGFQVIFGNALLERTLQRARFESVGVAIGLTANETLNGLFVERARAIFDVPRVHMALASLDHGVTPDLMTGSVLFEGPHDVERWDVRLRHGDVEVEQFLRAADPENEVEAEPAGERWTMLCIRRGQRMLVMHADLKLAEGDVASVAIHAPDREEAEEALRERGWQRVEVNDPESASATTRDSGAVT